MARWKILYVFGLLQTMLGLFSNAQRIYGDPHYSFVHNATEAPLVLRNYDYIIIGGGTAGCPLAATLSQNFTVLLLERGGSPYSNPLVENLVGFYPNLQINTPTSASQQFTSEDGVPNNRARVLGGGSAINAGFFTYADPQFVADAGWDAALVNASFAWVADEVAQLPTPGVFQSAARDALVEAGVAPYNGQTYEHLVGTKVGGSLFDRDGHRHTAADLLSYANSDNIDVYLYATAQRLLFVTGEERVVGVAYTDLGGGNHSAFLSQDARSEVIVAAGALGSPQLLMLSGIGPTDHLAEFNITTVVDNPEVGSQMADNPTNSLWVLTSEEVEVALIQVVGITSFGSYIEVSSGQAEALLGVLEEEEEFGESKRVMAQVLQSRIIGAILGTPRGPLRARAAWGGTVLQKIWGPQSRGLLRLESLDAGENPRVRFNYFQEEADLATCEHGVRVAMDAVTAPALARFQYTNETVPLPLRPVWEAVLASWPPRDAGNATQDSINIREWCLDSVITIWHYHGGCLVGEVVDQDYRVMGVQALRVIDGSTFRQSPGTNPQATVMMLGRYMGVQILRERLPR